MKKRILAILLTMITALSFVACGSSNENNANGTNVQGAEDIEADGVIYFSEFFSPDSNNICYCIEEEGAKDSVIHKVYVFKDGQAWMYPLRDLRIHLELGEVAKMTDDEILVMLDSKTQEVFDKEIDACNQLLAMDAYNDYVGEYGTYTGISKVKDAIEEYKQYLEGFDAKEEFALTDFVFEVYTDATGNNVEEEYVQYTQKSCNLSIIRFAQTALNDGADNFISEILFAGDGSYPGWVNDTLEGSNMVDCKINYMKEPKEVYEKVWSAERTLLRNGMQQIYDTYYGGFYTYDYYLLSRSSWEDGMVEGSTYKKDTMETADVVDKEEPYSR